MRRYAFESAIAHLSWLVFIFICTDGFAVSFASWLERFNQWDVRWYSSIAMDGHGLLPQTYAFPPLHAWILGRVTYAIFDGARALGFELTWMRVFYPVSLVLGLTYFALANTVFVVLAERRWKIRRWRLWLIAVANPVGYFALTAYSDALFFLIAALALLLATWTSERRDQWQLPELSKRHLTYAKIGLTGLLFAAPWIRLTGFAFALWIILKRREVIATFLSLVTYLTYMGLRTGDPLFFINVQQAFDMPNGTVVTGFLLSLDILKTFFSGEAYQGGDFLVYAMNFGFFAMVVFLLSIALVRWLSKRHEYCWALAVLAITIVSHNQAFWRSTVRYALPLYPMFFWMLIASSETPRTRLREQIGTTLAAIAVGLSLAIQVYYCRLFRMGEWAF